MNHDVGVFGGLESHLQWRNKIMQRRHRHKSMRWTAFNVCTDMILFLCFSIIADHA